MDLQSVKLFYLDDLDYSCIKKVIEFHIQAGYLIEKIAIFNRTSNPADNYYFIISFDERIHKIILESGGREAPNMDVYKSRIKEGQNTGDFVFGNEELINLL